MLLLRTIIPVPRPLSNDLPDFRLHSIFFDNLELTADFSALVKNGVLYIPAGSLSKSLEDPAIYKRKILAIRYSYADCEFITQYTEDYFSRSPIVLGFPTERMTLPVEHPNRALTYSFRGRKAIEISLNVKSEFSLPIVSPTEVSKHLKKGELFDSLIVDLTNQSPDFGKHLGSDSMSGPSSPGNSALNSVLSLSVHRRKASTKKSFCFDDAWLKLLRPRGLLLLITPYYVGQGTINVSGLIKALHQLNLDIVSMELVQPNNLYVLVQTKMVPITSRKVCLLYAYNHSPATAYNLNFFLDNYQQTKCSLPVDYTLIVNGEAELPLEKLQRDHWKILRRENYGYDFGAWLHGLESINLNDYEHFVFINDTVRGPFYRSKDMNWLQELLVMLTENTKLVGISVNCCTDLTVNTVYRSSIIPHVQSMLWATDRVGLDFDLPNDD